MKISILIPHWKTGKMTAYTIAQLLKYKGKHEVEIIVIDNNGGDGSMEYLIPFFGDAKFIEYPKGKLQSHGIAFDFALESGLVTNEYFITIESDSFPTNDTWIDYYENLINEGFDCAGSLLKLSGGEYIHPAGTLYKKSVWGEAKKYCENIEYSYFPNMAKKERFNCHLMIHNRVLNEFLNSPEKFIELSEEYKPFTKEKALERLEYYKPVVNPFHNGMGNLQESVKTYGQRNIYQDTPAILFDNKEDFIYRIGYEPGQWFSYWMLAMGKKVYSIPTQTFWMPNRENEQQERTINACGFTHLWGVSAYHDGGKEDVNDIVKRKKFLEDELYGSLPENLKTPLKEVGVNNLNS